MALDDRQHVEAVAIVRRLVESIDAFGGDAEAYFAGEQWLRENHPEPNVYSAALERSEADQS